MDSNSDNSSQASLSSDNSNKSQKSHTINNTNNGNANISLNKLNSINSNISNNDIHLSQMNIPMHKVFTNSQTQNLNTSSSNHTMLLSTITELRNDLEKALIKLQSYQETNQQLQENYDIIKEELIDTRKKYNQIKESYLKTMNEKVNMEKHYCDLIDKIKIQLDEKTKEFESQREKFIPQDINAIRMKVQEELEYAHKQRLGQIRMDMDKILDESLQLKTNYECKIVELESNNKHLHRTIDSLQIEIQDLKKVSNDRNSKLQSKLLTLSNENNDIIRPLKLENTELKSSLDIIRDERNKVQDNFYQSKLSYEDSINKLNNMISQLQTRLLSRDNEILESNEKLKHLHLELYSKDNLLKQQKESIYELNEKIQEMNNTIDTISMNYNNTINHLKLEITSIEKISQHDIYQLKESNQYISIQLHEHEKNEKKLMLTVNELQFKYEKNLRGMLILIFNMMNYSYFILDLRQSNQIKYNECFQKYSQSEIDYQKLLKEFNIIKLDLNNKNQLSSIETSNIKSELMKLKREKDNLHEKYYHFEVSTNSMIQNLQSKYDTLLKDYDETTEKQKLQLIEKENQFVFQIKELTNTKDRYMELYEQEKKKSNGYKEKAIKAHMKSKLLSSMVNMENIQEVIA